MDYNETGIAWFTLALVNAGLAETKGRSRLSWFLLSLFIGPIATLLIVVWPKVLTRPQPLHPIASVKDRFLVLATSAMVLVVLAGVVSVSAGIAGAEAWFVGVSILVALLSATAFVYSLRGYNRHAASR